jgi:UDP-N-acetylglucosamine--N-acetylmuramyl-(pentapeptide) pyrophosphoryl-undecaprenol N-acetylglucosamine transferase
VYPALNVLRELPEDDLELLWVGGDGGMEAELVKREGIPFASIPAAGVHGVGPSRLPGNVISLIKGFSQAKQVLKRFSRMCCFSLAVMSPCRWHWLPLSIITFVCAGY